MSKCACIEALNEFEACSIIIYLHGRAYDRITNLLYGRSRRGGGQVVPSKELRPMLVTVYIVLSMFVFST
jgi:hypothetical protein